MGLLQWEVKRANSYLSANINIETAKETDISRNIDKHKNNPLLCFANISMDFTWEETKAKTRTISPSPIMSNMKSALDSWNFEIKQPSIDDIFYPGQKIELIWSYLNIDETASLQIVLCQKHLIFDTDITVMNAKMNVQHLSVVIPVDLDTSSNNQYYFSFRFTHASIVYRKVSALFYISLRPAIVPRTPPSENEVFYPGDIVPLSWKSVNFAVSSQIIIRFCRARPIIPDSTLDTVKILATANSFNYTISSSLDRADNDKYYYFEFDYCTSWLSWNCKKSSNKFFVPSRPYLRPTFPNANDWFSPMQQLTLKWISANFGSAYELLEIKLRRYNFLLPDSDVDSFTCTLNSSGSCSRTLPDVEKSFSKYYFEFNWCKHWYSTDCIAKSNQFSIPTHAIGSWNYDEQQNQALVSKTLFSTSCNSLCTTHDIDLSYICQLCNGGRSMSIEINCTNCWTTYDYSVVHMEVVRKDNSPSLDKVKIHMNSRISVNVDFFLRIDYQRNIHGCLPLPPIPIGPSIIIAIGSIKFGVGLSFSPSILWNITEGIRGTITAGADYTWQTNLTLTSTLDNTTKEYTQNLIRHIHPIEGDFQANPLLDFAFRPELELQVGIFTVGLGTDIFVILESLWHYPPFTPLPSSIFNWNPQKIAPIHLSVPLNACLTNHFIRYHTTYGVRNTRISIKFDKDNYLNNFFKDLESSSSTKPALNLGPYELSSGCMYQADLSTDLLQILYLALNRQYNRIENASDQYFSLTIISDLAFALGISQTRIHHNSTFSMQQNQMTGITIIILPSTSSYSNNLNTTMIIKRFREQVTNTKSLLYYGIITNSLNLTYTLIMNNFRTLQT